MIVQDENIIEIPTDHAGRMHERSKRVPGNDREFMRKDADLYLGSNFQLMFQALLLDDLELGSLEFIVGFLQLVVLFLKVVE